MVRALSIVVKLLVIALPVSGGLLLLLWSSFKADSGVTADAIYFLFNQSETIASTVLVTLVAPLIACYLALWLAPGLLKRPRLQQLLSPLLSVPHVAFAVGLMLLFSPSGRLVRVIESVTGVLPLPPQGWPLPEKSLITVMIVLVLKELPFLLLMISSQLKQLPANAWLIQAQSYGYSERQAWWRVLTPELLKRLTLPMAAVIIYSLSVVDIPLLVGSNSGALLAQRVYEWTFQFSPESQSKAITGAWLLMALALVMLYTNAQHHKVYRKWVLTKPLADQLNDDATYSLSDKAGSIVWAILGIIALAIIAVLILQSLASSWFYPSLIPESLSVTRWLAEWGYLAEPTVNSFWLATVSGVLGTVCAVVMLQRERRMQRKNKEGVNVWVLVALFVPQVPMVLGWQLLLGERLNQGWQALWVLWSHTVYTMPYAYLVLHGAYTQFDEQWLVKAQSLGYSARQAWWKVFLPMLKAPIITAFAIAFSVSIAQYLPTQWLGQGATPTLTTEAVSVASGGDWRIGSLYALLQTLLPLIIFIGAGILNTGLRGKNSQEKRYAEYS